MKTDGHWRYAVRQVDEDGDVIIWESHGAYSYEPFTSAEDAREFASPWLENIEVIRTWIPAPEWEVVK